MAIEENQEQVIPSFNPESFMDEENEVSIGQSVIGVIPEETNLTDEDKAAALLAEKESASSNNGEEEVTFEDDFLSKTNTVSEKDFDPNDYIKLGETLGVEIKTKEDLESVQSKFKTEPAAVNTQKSDYNFSQEEQTSFQNLNKALEGANKATPEDLMKWHLKNINPEKYKGNLDELDYHIETLKDTGMFDSQEKEIRAKLVSDISEQQNSLISTAENRDDESKIAINQELQKEIKLYKEGFHGISVTPKDLLETFNSIRDGSVFEEIESNQANVAEMALLWKNKELFYKAFESPDPSVGVKKIMAELQNAQAKPAAGNKTLKNPHSFDPEAFINAEEIKAV